ncbi:MAG: hypothetical protein ACRD6W_11300, partial [Nitrososphaerales archaeon]
MNDSVVPASSYVSKIVMDLLLEDPGGRVVRECETMLDHGSKVRLWKTERPSLSKSSVTKKLGPWRSSGMEKRSLPQHRAIL